MRKQAVAHRKQFQLPWDMLVYLSGTHEIDSSC